MDFTIKAGDLIELVRTQKPLVHQITNYVTVNDCANITLAAGASPIMADDIGEVADITAISSALVLNIGTLNQRTIPSMLAAGKKASELGIPVVLDPVGAGASKLRGETAQAILREVKIAVLRGNISEIANLVGLDAAGSGVDAAEDDAGRNAVHVAETAARRYGCVSAVTGEIDVISDGSKTVSIHNGHIMLTKVTGTGCMTSALVGAYCGVSKDYLTAAISGVAAMGLAGEAAFERAGHLGTGSFRTALIDSISCLDKRHFETQVKLYDI